MNNTYFLISVNTLFFKSFFNERTLHFVTVYSLTFIYVENVLRLVLFVVLL